jgi:MYXO-CTERM domain-containing protein
MRHAGCQMTEPDNEPPSRRNALLALLALAVLVLLGWWLSDILAGVSRIQDCVMAGRRNCVIFH